MSSESREKVEPVPTHERILTRGKLMVLSVTLEHSRHYEVKGPILCINLDPSITRKPGLGNNKTVWQHQEQLDPIHQPLQHMYLG